MIATRTLLSIVYFAVAVLALCATWHQNLFYFQHGADPLTGFVQFWRETLVTPASVSITVDLGLFGLAVVVWMVVEGRRLGIRFVWVYVVLAMMIAISVTGPLFLIARERRLMARGEAGEAVALGRGDLVVIALFALPTLILSLWSLFR